MVSSHRVYASSVADNFASVFFLRTSSCTGDLRLVQDDLLPVQEDDLLLAQERDILLLVQEGTIILAQDMCPQKMVSCRSTSEL